MTDQRRRMPQGRLRSDQVQDRLAVDRWINEGGSVVPRSTTPATPPPAGHLAWRSRDARRPHRHTAASGLPALRGIPCRHDGFIQTDGHGRVVGIDDIYAAGDATDAPIKDGGHAALQADAVAAMIAFSAGIDIQLRLLQSCKSAAFWYAPSSPTPDTLGEAHQADLDDDACTDITTHDPAAILRLAEDAGIDLVKLAAELEREGVGAFRRSYHELLACIEDKLEHSAVTRGVAAIDAGGPDHSGRPIRTRELNMRSTAKTFPAPHRAAEWPSSSG
jgi:hypothetical protein